MALLSFGAAVVGGGLSIWGASQADAAQNEAIERQYEFDLKDWQYNKKTLKADYHHQRKGVDIARENDRRLREYKDQTNLQDWQHSLKIQDFEYASQMKQYAKSEQIYGQQLSFNKLASAAAREAEVRRLEDATNEIAFQNQDIVIKAMEAEGAAAVKGQQGRSAGKSDQAVLASLGRNQAILAESLLSARGETEAAMKKIAADKFGADIAAEAARMLKPERLPRPPKPITSPVTKYQNPRRPRKFDFGPKPIKGAKSNSMIGAIGSAVGGLATPIAGLANKDPGG